MSKKMGIGTILLFAILVIGVGSVLAWEPVEGPDVEPIILDGNPTCADLGYDSGFKIDPPVSGSTGIPIGYTVNYTVYTEDGIQKLDWTSDFGIDAVIIKGGNAGANLYVYDPPTESFGDDGLVSPDNPSGDPANISHFNFCYGLRS